jgi:inosose dehydratase
VPIDISNAPASWGVSYSGQKGVPAWATVLDEIAEAGYRAVELGPIGYCPEDPKRYGAELASRGLEVVAGHVFEPMHDPRKRAESIAAARRVLDMITPNGAKRLVVIDSISPERSATAGRRDVAPQLSKGDWATMMSIITDIARIATGEYGVMPTLHPHAATYIEYRDDVARAMDDLDPDIVKLCVDTGHLTFSGADPVEILATYGTRTQHLHFKDVDAAVRDRALADGIDFDSAVGRGVFCRLGKGMVDFAGVRRVLEATGYRGYATVEQDAEPSVALDPVPDARGSLAYLRSVGIAN